MDAWVVLGRVMAPYGIKGWLKVSPFTDVPEDLATYDPLWIKQGGQWKQTRIVRFQAHGKGWVAQLKHCDDRTQAEALCGADLGVPRSQLPALPDGEFYWSDLEGLDVFNQRGQWFGRIERMLETGANDVMVVAPVAGSLDDQERLIPYIPGMYVTRVDLGARRVEVDWEADY